MRNFFPILLLALIFSCTPLKIRPLSRMVYTAQLSVTGVLNLPTFETDILLPFGTDGMEVKAILANVALELGQIYLNTMTPNRFTNCQTSGVKVTRDGDSVNLSGTITCVDQNLPIPLKENISLNLSPRG